MNPHRALMIVDVQQAFEPPPAFRRRLERYSRTFPCRVFTRYTNPTGSMFRRVLKQKCCAPGSVDTKLLIPPSPGDIVINKTSYGLKPADIRRLKRARYQANDRLRPRYGRLRAGVMFSLFDAGIICHLKEDMCWSSSGLHQSAVRIIRAQFPEPR